MGLDMYLTARVSTWKLDDTPLRAKLLEVVRGEGLPLCDNLQTIDLKLEAAYWRKANQVHGWFVRECQEGVDECQLTAVGHEQLVELRNLCRKALATRDSTLLPPTAGFFFGGDMADQWYWTDLTDTDQQLTKLIEHPKFRELDFYYQSSW